MHANASAGYKIRVYPCLKYIAQDIDIGIGPNPCCVLLGVRTQTAGRY